MRRGSVVALIALGLAACKLTEVTVPEGEPRVVVQAVLSVGAAQQFVVVERSLTGSVSRESVDDNVPPGEPRIPIAGATVTLTHEGPSACSPATDTLQPYRARGGIYVTSTFCRLQAGDRVRLRVETPDSVVVTGATVIPGARHVSVRLSTDSATVEGDTLQMDRLRDTLHIAVDPVLARALQVEVRRLDDPDEIAVFLFTDTLGVALPGNLYNPFEGDSGKPVFEVGVTYTLTVAVTDSNYFDFVRSFSDPIRGRGFLNRLDGGIGVFGSVAAYRYGLRVVR
jgi:hypothetical protein